MEKNQDYLQQIYEIRSLMSRSTRFISLSGLAGIFAGSFALIGAIAAYFFMQSMYNIDYYDITRSSYVVSDMSMIAFFFVDAGLVLLLSLVAGVFFTTRNAKSQGQKVWSKTTRQMLINLFVPLAVGGILCLILLFKFGFFGIIAPITLVFYGLALLNASKYTLDEIKYLGLTEIILGLLGCWFIGYGLVIWAIGFGVLHIIYGGMMYYKYERK